MNDTLNVATGFVIGVIITIIIGTFLNENPRIANEHIYTTVYQPEYNHRIDIVTAKVVSDSAQTEIYCIWYKDQIFMPNK